MNTLNLRHFAVYSGLLLIKIINNTLVIAMNGIFCYLVIKLGYSTPSLNVGS